MTNISSKTKSLWIWCSAIKAENGQQYHDILLTPWIRTSIRFMLKWNQWSSIYWPRYRDSDYSRVFSPIDKLSKASRSHCAVPKLSPTGCKTQTPTAALVTPNSATLLHLGMLFQQLWRQKSKSSRQESSRREETSQTHQVDYSMSRSSIRLSKYTNMGNRKACYNWNQKNNVRHEKPNVTTATLQCQKKTTCYPTKLVIRSSLTLEHGLV